MCYYYIIFIVFTIIIRIIITIIISVNIICPFAIAADHAALPPVGAGRAEGEVLYKHTEYH